MGCNYKNRIVMRDTATLSVITINICTIFVCYTVKGDNMNKEVYSLLNLILKPFLRVED